jgi:Na+/H+-dicarboxylate symporter
MPDGLVGVLFIVVIAAFATAIGIGFGIVVAPRIGRLLDRADTDDDEEPGDRAD